MTAVPVCLQEAAPVMNHGSQPTFWSTAMRDQAASKNGPRRLIFGMKANRRYYDETQLGGTSSEFPFSTGSRWDALHDRHGATSAMSQPVTCLLCGG
eukprot:14144-Eustigmatos_ZCMA.PRE.1